MLKTLFLVFGLIAVSNAMPSIHNQKARDEVTSKLKNIAGELSQLKDFIRTEEKKEADEEQKKREAAKHKSQNVNPDLEPKLLSLKKDLQDLKAQLKARKDLKSDELKKVKDDLTALHTHLDHLKRSVQQKKDASDEKAMEEEMKREEEEEQQEEEEEKREEEEMEKEDEEEEKRIAAEEAAEKDQMEKAKRESDKKKVDNIKMARDELMKAKDYFKKAKDLMDDFSNKKKKRELSLEDQLDGLDEDYNDDNDYTDTIKGRYQRSYYSSALTALETEAENLGKSAAKRDMSQSDSEDLADEAKNLNGKIQEITKSLDGIMKKVHDERAKKRRDHVARAKVEKATENEVNKDEFEAFDTIKSTDNKKDSEVHKIDDIMSELQALKDTLKN